MSLIIPRNSLENQRNKSVTYTIRAKYQNFPQEVINFTYLIILPNGLICLFFFRNYIICIIQRNTKALLFFSVNQSVHGRGDKLSSDFQIDIKLTYFNFTLLVWILFFKMTGFSFLLMKFMRISPMAFFYSSSTEIIHLFKFQDFVRSSDRFIVHISLITGEFCRIWRKIQIKQLILGGGTFVSNAWTVSTSLMQGLV